MASGGEPLAALIFFHGGGFVVGSLDTHDGLCRLLCAEGKFRVIAIDYRLAPEHRFPAALDDAFAATQWIAAARSHGLAVGSSPATGATVVFSPGVEGAGGGGHVGHVEQVLSGGWFIISEMNFYWNGGGWGHVDYRYVHTGSGVAFIY